IFFFFFKAEDGIRDWSVTGVQTCALPIWIGSRGGKITRRCDPREGARLVKTILRGGQRLVGLEQLLLIAVQLGVVVDLPPRAFGNCVLGLSHTPWGFRFVGGRSRHRRTMVVRSDGASR